MKIRALRGLPAGRPDLIRQIAARADFRRLLLLLGLTLLPSPRLASGAPSLSIEEAARDLATQIIATYQVPEGAARPKIAVLELSDLNGHVNNVGRLLAEELITNLFITGHFPIVERSLLNKILEEQRLVRDGLVDPEALKNVGRLLGTRAIVTGTIVDEETAVSVSARVIATDNGEILAVASARVSKDRAFDALSKASASMVSANLTSQPADSAPKKNTFENWAEDFSAYKVGDTVTEWGQNLIVMKGSDGRMYLGSQTPGHHRVVKQVSMGDRFVFEFDWSAFDARDMGQTAPWVRMPLNFWDADGNNFYFEMGNWGLNLPGRPSVDFQETKMNRFRLERRDREFKIFNNGQFIATYVVKKLGPIERVEFEVPVTSSGQSQWFTAFRLSPL